MVSLPLPWGLDRGRQLYIMRWCIIMLYNRKQISVGQSEPVVVSPARIAQVNPVRHTAGRKIKASDAPEGPITVRSPDPNSDIVGQHIRVDYMHKLWKTIIYVWHHKIMVREVRDKKIAYDLQA